jgi:hypothetical protein
MTSIKYAYKTLPTFAPAYYRQWASVVRDAFAEREWSNYLVPPQLAVVTSTDDGTTTTTAPPFTPDGTTSARAKAFLSQSIPMEYVSSIESCTTAAQIWTTFLQRYGSRSREDELRLEAQLLEMTKSTTVTVDEHIQSFDDLLSAIKAQQTSRDDWDNPKINQYFLRTLEKSEIHDEDWKGFVTYLGSTWSTITKEQLFAATRTYYLLHMASKKTVSITDERLLAVSTQFQAPGPHNRGRGRGTNRARGRGTTRQPGTRPPPNLPRDPNAWCTHCEIPGHSFEMCWKRTQEPGYIPPLSSGQPPTAPSTGQQSTKPLYPARGLTVTVYKSSIGGLLNVWLHDSCCTQHMTGEASHFTTYDSFPKPIPVYGIGDNVLYAYGEGTVILEDPNGNTHDICVWWVDGLKESIISKSSTKSHGLRTSMDQYENIILQGNHDFQITSREINNMTAFIDVKVVHRSVKALTTMTASLSADSESSTPESTTTVSLVSHYTPSEEAQLIHERLGHSSAERLRLLGIKYTAGFCRYYIFFLNGGPIVWASRKQKYTVALSTMESEYVALTEAAKEAAFLRKLLNSINLPQTNPTLILTDSESALKNVKNNVNHSRSKHIDTRHHYIRLAYNSGQVDIRHIPAASQTADILTKPLGIIKHVEAVKLLTLHNTHFT